MSNKEVLEKFEAWLRNCIAPSNPAGISATWERGARTAWQARSAEIAALQAQVAELTQDIEADDRDFHTIADELALQERTREAIVKRIREIQADAEELTRERDAERSIKEAEKKILLQEIELRSSAEAKIGKMEETQIELKKQIQVSHNVLRTEYGRKCSLNEAMCDVCLEIEALLSESQKGAGEMNDTKHLPNCYCGELKVGKKCLACQVQILEREKAELLEALDELLYLTGSHVSTAMKQKAEAVIRKAKGESQTQVCPECGSKLWLCPDEKDPSQRWQCQTLGCRWIPPQSQTPAETEHK